MTSINWVIAFIFCAVLLIGCQQPSQEPETYFHMSSNEVIAFEFGATDTLAFYDTIGDGNSAFNLHIQSTSKASGDSLFFPKLDYKNFSPLAFNKKVVRLAFEVLDQQEGWLQVIINTHTKETRWIRPTKDFIILPWEEFLTDLASIHTGFNSCKVLKQADKQASPIRNCESISCLKAWSARDEWLLVTAQHTDCDLVVNKNPNTAIQWKNNKNELLIDFDY